MRHEQAILCAKAALIEASGISPMWGDEVALKAAEAAVKTYLDAIKTPLVETGWLIERTEPGMSGNLYFGGGRDRWTDDHVKAIRFQRKDDAEIVARFSSDMDGATYRVCEHQWG